MAQRVLVAACLLMVGACCAMAGVMWNQSTRAAVQAAEANQRLAELLARSQTTNEEMLRQLQAMPKPSSTAKSLDWVPASLRLTLEKLDGPPAVGYEAWLGRGDGGSTRDGAIHRVSDGEGLVDFGVVQPGDWEFRLQGDVDGGRTWKLSGNLNVIPGTPVSKQIICPGMTLDTAPCVLRVDWPKDLADKGLSAVALLEFYGPRYQPPKRWGLWKSEKGGWQRRQVFVGVGANQHEIEVAYNVDPDPSPYVWRLPTPSEAKLFDERSLTAALVNPASEPSKLETSQYPDRLFTNLRRELVSPSPGADHIELEVGDYSLERLIVVRPHTDPKTASGWQTFRVLALIQSAEDSTYYQLVSRQADGILNPIGVFVPATANAIRERYWRDNRGRFVAHPGQKNEWTIPLPDELIRSVRASLTDEPKARSAQHSDRSATPPAS